MKIKIDENLPVDLVERFKKAGCDSETVYSEGIEGCSDKYLITVCKKEQRVLLTLDNHFCNIKAYPPEEYCGIVVLRVDDQSKMNVLNLIDKVLPILKKEDLSGRLWIVEKDRIRVRGYVKD